jgi:hypothetical protein
MHCCSDSRHRRGNRGFPFVACARRDSNPRPSAPESAPASDHLRWPVFFQALTSLPRQPAPASNGPVVTTERLPRARGSGFPPSRAMTLGWRGIPCLALHAELGADQRRAKRQEIRESVRARIGQKRAVGEGSRWAGCRPLAPRPRSAPGLLRLRQLVRGCDRAPQPSRGCVGPA